MLLFWWEVIKSIFGLAWAELVIRISMMKLLIN